MASNAFHKGLSESSFDKLQHENAQLLVELHCVQEALENCYRESQANLNNRSPDELVELHAENQRLRTSVAVQRNVHELESNCALNARLGNILIECADAPSSIFSVLGKLTGFWRQSRRQVPPDALGGKDFSKIIATYSTGGFDAIEKSIASLSVLPSMLANAYTALARQLMNSDRAAAAEAARRAYNLDPKGYRLKWLAFRLHESGEVVEAEAMLDILPAETPFSNSEARQVSQVRNEAKRARKKEAKRLVASTERRAEGDKHLNNPVQERDPQATLSADRERDVAALKEAVARLEDERLVLALERDCLELKLQESEMVSVRTVGENRLLLENLHQAQEELERLADECERLRNVNDEFVAEKQELAAKYEVQSQLHEERVREFGALMDVRVRLEKEGKDLAAKHEAQCRLIEERSRMLDALAAGHEAQGRLIEERDRLIGTLERTKVQLGRERLALSVKHESELRTSEERGRQVDALKQSNFKLEQDRQALAIKHAVQAEVAAERVRELESQRQAIGRIEEEKRALAVAHEMQSKLAGERSLQLEALKQGNAKLEREKRDAQARAAEAVSRELESVKQAKLELEQAKSSQNKRLQSPLVKSGNGDAEIDDLIMDLELVFNGRAIVYVDVGAYVGDVFLKIRRSAKTFRIHEAHLFEPNPTSYTRLTKEVSGGDGPVVHLYNLAVGESGDTRQFISARSMTKVLSGDSGTTEVPSDAFIARCVSLDSQSSIFTDGKINLLKIDVEGREIDVLKSARNLLMAQSVDILYIEVGFNRTGTQQTYFAEVDQLLQGFGYRVMRIYDQKGEWMSDSPVLRRANVAYMSEKFARAHPFSLIQELQELRSRVSAISN
ncbi:FkbM family methyltransferase [Paraburkholderia dinghuensis]|nr:FkbM family methyltransferase [Paraburkholderia dinghuensis]